jgi:serine/threonine protein phosphatase PrpC
MKFGAVTDLGKHRKINEDSFYIHKDDVFPYAFVADGMGGHQAGEVASMMVVDIVNNRVLAGFEPSMDYVEVGEIMRQAFIAANNVIYNYAKNYYKVMGMGTTATMACVYQNKIITAHVGDSRVYAIGDQIRQITKDHSYVQELVTRGEITPEQARNHPKKNYITRAMGAEETVKVDISIQDYHGEVILVCSDGLTNFVTDEEIKEKIRFSADLQQAAQSLVDMANQNGGKDNITLVAFDK